MFDHVTIRVSDRAASERFYDTLLGTLGIPQTYNGEMGLEWEELSFIVAGAEDPVTRRLHIAWSVSSREQVQAFWQAGVDAGFRDDGGPGPRPQYGDDYYGGFLLDPDGNSVEAVHFDGKEKPLTIDHLWIRVADVAAAKAFYETIAPHAGLLLADDTAERAQFRSGAQSFSLVAGEEPTENVHFAFAGDDAAVDAFHAAAMAGGHRDNGGPGERTAYHPGYYSAFVLDPDGNNVEVVNHNR